MTQVQFLVQLGIFQTIVLRYETIQCGLFFVQTIIQLGLSHGQLIPLPNQLVILDDEVHEPLIAVELLDHPQHSHRLLGETVGGLNLLPVYVSVKPPQEKIHAL